MSLGKFIIEDVHCFAGKHEFNLRPITLLVGENSTGKSTALGCLHTLINFSSGKGGLDFNVEPYLMGSFSNIIRRTNPRKKEFQLGIEVKGESGTNGFEFYMTFSEHTKGSEPVIKELRITSTDGDEWFFIVQEDTRHLKEARITTDKKADGKEKVTIELNTNQLIYMEHLIYAYGRERRQSEDRSFKLMYDLLMDVLRIGQAHSFAPIRSKPKRTYDPLKESIDPEGSEIPMVLANMSRAKGENWDELKKQLTEFGKASGLFKSIDVRLLGKSKSDPFQLRVRVRGPTVNLLDVGYGVNQILPVLVRILNVSRSGIFLMQQPEVHLHPKAQAELTSLLIQLAKDKQHNFIIETHSDYMIDRARIDIMTGKIKPEDVSLIYLEPTGNTVQTHNICFDKEGNFVGVPKKYRDFFIRESDKLLGFSED